MTSVLRFWHQFPWGKALLLWALVIFYFSSLAGSPYPLEVTSSYYLERKGAHVFEYFVLSLLIYGFAQKRFPQEKTSILAVLAIFGATLYGISDELHQYLVPFRGSKLTDVGFDFLGACLAMLILVAWRYYLSQYRYKKSLNK
ncbi:MAG: VanZ family protein [Patescibacteria group bacterium]